MISHSDAVDDTTRRLRSRTDHPRLVSAAATSGGSVIALVGEVGSDRAAADAARLASALASSGRRTVLASLEADGSRLDARLGGDGRTGLTDVLAGRARLANIAVLGRVPGVIYLPAGGSPWPPRRVIESTAFQRLVSQIRNRKALLLLYVTEIESLACQTAASALDGLVMIDATLSRPDGLRIPVLEVSPASRESASEISRKAWDPGALADRHPGGWRGDTGPNGEPVVLVRRRSRGRRSQAGLRGELVAGFLFVVLTLSAALAWIGAEATFGRDPIEMLLRSLNPASQVDDAGRSDPLGRDL